MPHVDQFCVVTVLQRETGSRDELARRTRGTKSRDANRERSTSFTCKNLNLISNSDQQICQHTSHHRIRSFNMCLLLTGFMSHPTRLIHRYIQNTTRHKGGWGLDLPQLDHVCVATVLKKRRSSETSSESVRFVSLAGI